jgi:hypothetical protein
VEARGREWVVLPSPDDDILNVRPLSGSEADARRIALALELSNRAFLRAVFHLSWLSEEGRRVRISCLRLSTNFLDQVSRQARLWFVRQSRRLCLMARGLDLFSHKQATWAPYCPQSSRPWEAQGRPATFAWQQLLSWSRGCWFPFCRTHKRWNGVGSSAQKLILLWATSLHSRRGTMRRGELQSEIIAAMDGL